MFCKECNKKCWYIWEDHGVGGGEFWGSSYRDVRDVPVSDCCGATLYEDEELTVELDGSMLFADEEATRGDWLYEQRRDEMMEG